LSLNFHSIANNAITVVNSNIKAILREYKGLTTVEGRHRVPIYEQDRAVILQLQPLSRGDLEHLHGLNLQRLYKSIHINSEYYSVVRSCQNGGDLFIIGNDTWLVVQSLELWSSWSQLLVVLQTDRNEE